MLKPILLLGVFGAGVAVGAIAMRNYYGKSSAAVGQPATVTTTAPSASPRVEAAESRAATPLSAVTVPSGDTANVERASAADAGSPDTGSVVQAIDAGPTFNKMLAEGSQSGHANQIGDAHRALERETRDEGWAYTMESELQGAMVNEVAMSAFKVEHIECRTTLCEVRLSGAGPQQAEALKRWNESFIGQESPLGQRLFLNYSSSIGEDDRTNLLMIFRKPPPPGSTPQETPPPPGQPVKKAMRKVALQG